MNSSDIPSRITKAFGVNGLKNAIPVDSSAATDNGGVATFDKGFPPITMQPLSAGGIPPSGKDMNGVLYSATLQQQWQNAGMTYPFSQDFSDAISGYPKGAIVPSSVYTGQWLNLNEANGTPPESSTGASTGWVPINNYGITQITMTTGSVVMSSLQAAKDRIIISGTLTANVNLIFPAWIKSWVVHNNCTGNFTVTCRTASGSGVVVIPGLVSRIFCDGVNISDETYNPNNDMVGMVAAFAANAAPTGWLAANGGLISRVTYARLFSRIGTTFGAGDGSTTFALPDMRGEFVRGWDNGRGVDVGRAFGSWQKGSVVVGDDGIAGVNVASSNSPDKSSLGLDPGGSETYPISIAPGANNQLGNQYFGYSRPRNYALLYCIKF
ncbi:phage tail protein [Cronobacter sakazakii]|uniref:phage tail protein n=2 Tax=Pseudomonadati TaxID=3379134 RepID=UPI00029BD98E|nr:phage tail protein [Cronobacter sakazakii]CCK03347.1 PUTATIVE TAIL FIBER-RELATED PROTEIN [Cronobacter sakazakii 701]ELY4207642.1 tail fiber protein [Cronobacter sakazakii]ELY6233047.1 tail fiber protein [Cronobacter sakazakii]KAB1499886.1 phage tail protein [Cronobacter sakazakii]MCI0196943.1 phage tail protein [Cronobacter sakazakii]